MLFKGELVLILGGLNSGILLYIYIYIYIHTQGEALYQKLEILVNKCSLESSMYVKPFFA